MLAWQPTLRFAGESLIVGAAATAFTVLVLGAHQVPLTAFFAVALIHFVRRMLSARLGRRRKT